MPNLGSGLSFGSFNKIPGYDYDASSYIQQAGITSETSRTRINEFIIGIKATGLWPFLIFWPLRSTQNVGTGLTAYSFGGLGNYPGTLTSSSMWSTNGLAVLDSAWMDTGLTLGASDSIISVHTTTSDGGNNNAMFFSAGVNVNGRQFAYGNSAVADIEILSVYRDTWSTSAGTIGTSFVNNGIGGRIGSRYLSFRPQSNTTINATLNNTITTGTAITGWANSSAGPIRARGYVCPNEIGFFAVSKVIISDYTDSIIRNLYKTTLGLELGLP